LCSSVAVDLSVYADFIIYSNSYLVNIHKKKSQFIRRYITSTMEIAQISN
jgi:hypothetical protein